MRDLSTLAAFYAIGIIAVPWLICRSLPPVENSSRALNPVQNPLNEDTDRDSDHIGWVHDPDAFTNSEEGR